MIRKQFPSASQKDSKGTGDARDWQAVQCETAYDKQRDSRDFGEQPVFDVCATSPGWIALVGLAGAVENLEV